MPTTDEELDKQREAVEKKREQLADAIALRDTRERELSNDIFSAQLKAEDARLSVELSLAREAAKATNVKAGAADILDTNREAAAADAERAKAVTTTGKE